VRIQNNTENCEARKGHLGDETSPILPTSPILDPFAIVSRAAMGEGVGSRPHAGPWPLSVRSSRPRLDPDARRSNRRTLKGRVLSCLFGASLGSQAAETRENRAVLANCGTWTTWRSRSLRLGFPLVFLTIGLINLGLLSWMFFSGKWPSIQSISLSSIVPGASRCSSGLLPDRFILQDERRLWRRIKPRMPMMNQGRFHDCRRSWTGRGDGSMGRVSWKSSS